MNTPQDVRCWYVNDTSNLVAVPAPDAREV